MGTTRSGSQGIDSERPYGWYGRPRCRQGKEGETAGRCLQPRLRLRRVYPTGACRGQGQGHRLRHGHELRADGRTAHQGAAHRFGLGCGQLRAGLRVRRRRSSHRALADRARTLHLRLRTAERGVLKNLFNRVTYTYPQRQITQCPNTSLHA